MINDDWGNIIWVWLVYWRLDLLLIAYCSKIIIPLFSYKHFPWRWRFSPDCTCSICIYLNSNSMSIDRRMSSIQSLTWPKFFPNRNFKSVGKILARSVVFEPITWLANFMNFSIVYVKIFETKDKMLAARGCRSLFKMQERLCRIMDSNKGEFWFVEAGLVFKWLILTKNIHFGLLKMDK